MAITALATMYLMSALIALLAWRRWTLTLDVVDATVCKAVKYAYVALVVSLLGTGFICVAFHNEAARGKLYVSIVAGLWAVLIVQAFLFGVILAPLEVKRTKGRTTFRQALAKVECVLLTPAMALLVLNYVLFARTKGVIDEILKQ